MLRTYLKRVVPLVARLVLSNASSVCGGQGLCPQKSLVLYLEHHGEDVRTQHRCSGLEGPLGLPHR